MFKRIHSDHFNSSSASHQDSTTNSPVRPLHLPTFTFTFTCNGPLLRIFFSTKLLLMEDFYSWISRFKTVELMRRVFLVFPPSFQQRRMMVKTRRLRNIFKHNTLLLCLNVRWPLRFFAHRSDDRPRWHHSADGEFAGRKPSQHFSDGAPARRWRRRVGNDFEESRLFAGRALPQHDQ